jgi:hypothetical protein
MLCPNWSPPQPYQGLRADHDGREDRRPRVAMVLGMLMETVQAKGVWGLFWDVTMLLLAAVPTSTVAFWGYNAGLRTILIKQTLATA